MIEVRGPIDSWANLGVQAFTDQNGKMLILGSRFDDDLTGGAGDDDRT